MDKLESITIENNEQYLRQSSKKVDISDPELHNNIVVLQDYCMQNDVMAMAAVQLGIPKRIVYVKNTNLEILNKRLTDEGKEETKDYIFLLQTQLDKKEKDLEILKNYIENEEELYEKAI